jgi:cytochrome bd-type quinol oxidase subunit 1
MLDLLPSAIDLARLQFAFTVVWHFLFPAFTIGLASYLAVLEAFWLWTGKDVYLDTFRYWLKIFAVAFAMGVVSGIVMSYQFGTNWSVFADKTAPVLGPLFGYEVLTAFFLEAGFLGVMLFGLNRVGPRLHFLATCLVAVGTLMSAFWILSANSWMHTPGGYSIAPDGRFMPADWWSIVFNRSFPFRLAHTVTAAYLTTAMIVGAVGAWHLLKNRDNPRARLMFSMAMWMAALVAPVQLVLGDLHGTNTYEHQTPKVAAMEGHFETERGASSLLFGWPDAEAGVTRWAIGIPNLASLYLTHDWNGEGHRAERLSARKLADQPAPGLLGLSHHGGPGASDDCAGNGIAVVPLERAALREQVAAPFRRGHGTIGPDRRYGRLDRHGSRPSAVHRVRHAAHRRQRVADRRAGGGRLARRIRGGVFHRVRRRNLVSVPALLAAAARA